MHSHLLTAFKCLLNGTSSKLTKCRVHRMFVLVLSHGRKPVDITLLVFKT